MTYLPAALLLLLPAASGPSDWPQFRGPTAQGHYEGSLPVEWAADKNVAWKQTVPGSGWSSPVIVAGRVYLTASVPQGEGAKPDQALRVLCLDAADGKTLWDTEAFRQEAARSPNIHRKNTHASPTPFVTGDRLYAHFGHAGTACLDLAGKVLWRNAELKYAPVHGNGGSPVLVGDLLVFSVDGTDRQEVLALDAATGKVRWRRPREAKPARPFSFGTPLLIEVDGKQQLVSQGSDVVIAYEPASGKELWRVRYSGYSVVPRPVFGQGLVFVCTGFDTPNLLAIRPDGAGDVTATHVAWKLTKAAPHTPSPLLVGTELYLVADKGTASCLDAKTGKVHWQERLTGDYSASPLHADGKLYFLSEDGVGTVVAAGKEFRRLAENRVGERSLASYAAAGGALFLRTEKHLYRIQGK